MNVVMRTSVMKEVYNFLKRFGKVESFTQFKQRFYDLWFRLYWRSSAARYVISLTIFMFLSIICFYYIKHHLRHCKINIPTGVESVIQFLYFFHRNVLFSSSIADHLMIVFY